MIYRYERIIIWLFLNKSKCSWIIITAILFPKDKLTCILSQVYKVNNKYKHKYVNEHYTIISGSSLIFICRHAKSLRSYLAISTFLQLSNCIVLLCLDSADMSGLPNFAIIEIRKKTFPQRIYAYTQNKPNIYFKNTRYIVIIIIII